MSLFESLAKAAIGIVKTPIAIAADIVTLGGTLNEEVRDETYTGETLSEVWDNLKDATKSGEQT